jgi:hypothetical protein
VDDRNSFGTATFDWTVDPVSVSVANPGNQKSRVASALRLQVNAADNNGGAISYSAAGLPTGLSINGSTGLISGSPTKIGNYSVTITARDGSTTGSVQLPWAISGPSVSHLALRGVRKGKPMLLLTLSAANGSSPIKELVVGLPRGLGFSKAKLSRPRLGGSKKLKLSGGKLIVVLSRGARGLALTIRWPTLSASSSLVSQVKHHRAGKLVFTFKATDGTGYTTNLVVVVKPS